MTNEFNLEEYIKDVSPELQEKAKACSTKEELLQLAADEDLEIPMDALEGVAGGCGGHECNVDRVLETYQIGSPFPIIKGIECSMVTKRACSECGNVKFFACEFSTFDYGARAELSQAEYNSVKATNKEYIPQPGDGYHGGGNISIW